MKKGIMCMLLALALSTSAFAMEVPTNTMVQNLNGSQQCVKVYTVSPKTDPADLIEEAFDYDGFIYTYASMTKQENRAEDAKTHTETVTVETAKKDLDTVLEQLAPTMEYDDGLYSGTLALDHTTIRTEAAGYTTKSYTVSETKIIGQLDRNDMSYVPATTVKDGVTLQLSNVDWQVTGTDLVGETLAPSSWQAVASYSGKGYYSAATGYITTAEYTGEVARDDVESVTYTLTYLGTEYDEAAKSGGSSGSIFGLISALWPFALGVAGLAAVIVLTVLLLRSRRQIGQLQAAQASPEEECGEEESEEEET